MIFQEEETEYVKHIKDEMEEVVGSKDEDRTFVQSKGV